MKTTTALLQAGVLALTCSFLATNATAALIFVDNASFETLPVGGLPLSCGAGCSYSLGLIPGWLNSPADSGQFQPGAPGNSTYFDSLSDGPTSAFSQGSTISQIVVPTVQAGVLYTLLVDVGSRKGAAFTGTAALFINGIQYNAVGAPLPGAFSTFTATYTGLLADVGQSIEIRLLSFGEQGNFDNVRLDADASGVPEPGTMALLGLGLTGLGLLRRKFVA